MNKFINYIFYSLFFLLFSNLANADTIKFWTTEEQPARLAKQNAMAAEFWQKTGHEVEVIPVSEKDLGKRATAAFAAGDLPDVIYHTLQYVLPWSEAGILDVETNDEIVNSLMKRTFAPGAIKMAQFDGKTAAVFPSNCTILIAPGAKVLFISELTMSSLVSTSKIPASDHGRTYCNV